MDGKKNKALFDYYKEKEFNELSFVDFIEKDFNQQNIDALIVDEFADTLIIEFKPTNFCNLDCKYCCFHDKILNYFDLKLLTNFFKLIDYYLKLLQYKKIYLFIYGGEPTLYPDLNIFLQKFTEKYQNLNVKILIQSNGITPFYENFIKNRSDDLIDFYKKNNIVFSFSYHHEELKRLKKIERFKKNAIYLNKLNLLQEITIMFNLTNIKEYIQIYNIFKKNNLPLYGRTILQESKLYNKKENQKYKKFISYNEKNMSLIVNNKKIKVSFEDLTNKEIFNFYNYYCLAGYTSFLTDSDGKIYRCDLDFLYKKNSIFDLNNFNLNFNEFKNKINSIKNTKCSHTFCSIYFSDKYKERD